MEKTPHEKELEKALDTIRHLEARLAEATAELERTNSELLQLTVELDDRVASRTADLEREMEERRRANEKLVESESRIRAIAETANDAIVQVDNDAKIIYWNPAAERIFGYSNSEAMGKDVASLIVPERMREEHKKGFAVFKETGEGNLIGKTVEVPALKKDGSEFPVGLSLAAAKVGGQWHSIGIIRDITEHKKAEEMLKESERRFRETLEDVSLITVQLDTRGSIFFANNFLLEITGWRRDEVAGAYWFEKFIPIERRSEMERVFKEIIESGGETHPHYENPIVTRDGEMRLVSWSNIVLRDVHGNIIGTSSIGEDITERKRAEEELELNEQRLKSSLELAQMRGKPVGEIGEFVLEAAVSLTGSRLGFIGLMNESESVMTVLRWSRDAMRECNVDRESLDFPIEGSGLWGEVVRQRKPIIVNDYDAPGPYKKGLPEGHVGLKRFLGVPVLNGDRIVALGAVGNKKEDYNYLDVDQMYMLLSGMWRNLELKWADEKLKSSYEQLQKAHADLKKTQSMMIRQEKLASLGALSAGVAHEIKNPLNIISTSVQLMMMEKNVPKENMDAYKIIIEQINRAVKITENLRDFARERKPEIQDIDLGPFLEKTIALVEYEMRGEGLEIVRQFHGEPVRIKGDPDQLAQVFLNIIGNARDSMNDKKSRHSYDELQEMGWEGKLLMRTAIADGIAQISFRDTGMGISRETIGRVFDPFYTTKGEKGTGLGMSIALGIIESHNGNMTVESEPGEWAEFIVTLPLPRQEDFS